MLTGRSSFEINLSFLPSSTSLSLVLQCFLNAQVLGHTLLNANGGVEAYNFVCISVGACILAIVPHLIFYGHTKLESIFHNKKRPGTFFFFFYGHAGAFFSSSTARSLPVEKLLPQNVGSIINYLQ